MQLNNRVVFLLSLFMLSLLTLLFMGRRTSTHNHHQQGGIATFEDFVASKVVLVSTTPEPSISTEVDFRFVVDESANVKKLIEIRSKWKTEQWAEESIRLLALNKMKNDWVIIAIANNGMLELSMNFIASMKRNGFEKFLVFCLDYAMYTALVINGLRDNAVMVPTNWVGDMQVTNTSVNWGEGQYHKLLHARWLLLLELLTRNYPFIFSDVDVVFNSPFVIEHTLYHIGRGCLQGGDCYGDFVGLTESQTDFNMGYFAIRPTQLMIDMFTETATLLLEKKFEVDQFAFNAVGKRRDNRYAKEFKRLDKFLYANGYIFHLRHFNQKWGIKPLLVHINWSEGNLVKKNRLKAQQLWFIGDQFATAV